VNYLLKDENAVYYECGFSCDNQLFLKLGSESFFITDPRYALEAKEQCSCEVVEAKDLAKAARTLIRKAQVEKIYYNPKEFTCADLEALKGKLSVEFLKKENLSWLKRIIKTPQEIELIRRSVELNAQAFDEFANSLSSLEGESEKRLHFEAIKHLSRYGEFELSFNPIVAINENSAKPHAFPSNKRLKRGDLLLFDAGIRYKRYCSDRTRTIFVRERATFSKEQTFPNPKIQKAYDLVRKAQEEAIKRARSGMKAKELDKIAREIIDKSEFKGCFVHSLGHGVGLDIHEMPFINSLNEQILEDGMVFTIEPGIYVAGEFGIRIEDIVVLKDGRAEVL